MTEPLFPSTSRSQTSNPPFRTTKKSGQKNPKNSGSTPTLCLDKAVLPQGGGGVLDVPAKTIPVHVPHSPTQTMQTAILHLWANIIFYEQDFSRLHHLWSNMATYDVDLHHAHTALLFPCRYPDCSHKCRWLPPSQLTSGELLGEPNDKGLPGFWAMSLAADEKSLLQK